MTHASLASLLVDCEGAPDRTPFFYFASHLTFTSFAWRLLADRRWCDAFAAAAARYGAGQRVLVLGLGSGVPALAAAQAGAEVTWATRALKQAELATRLAAANGVGARVRAARAAEWALLGDAGLPKVDVVVIEEIPDDLLSDGLLGHARVARSLLKPGGRVVPSGASFFCALASIRTTTCAGFDLRGGAA